LKALVTRYMRPVSTEMGGGHSKTHSAGRCAWPGESRTSGVLFISGSGFEGQAPSSVARDTIGVTEDNIGSFPRSFDRVNWVEVLGKILYCRSSSTTRIRAGSGFLKSASGVKA
jgi:hypothetical protein